MKFFTFFYDKKGKQTKNGTRGEVWGRETMEEDPTKIGTFQKTRYSYIFFNLVLNPIKTITANSFKSFKQKIEEAFENF